MAKKGKNTAKEEGNESKSVKIYKVNGSESKADRKARRDKSIQLFLIVLIIILAIAAIFSALKTFFPNVLGGISLSGKLAAKINGQPITTQELDAQYGRMGAQYQALVTKEAFLGQLIDQTLLTQEAAKQKLSVSEKEIDDNLNAFMSDNNITREALDEILKQKQLTLLELRNLVRNQLVINKLLEVAVKSKVNVTTEEALQYYNDNPNTFKVPERVTARHILIALVNRTPDEAKKIAVDVLANLQDDKSNFCDLVTKYSDDSGSLGTCGEYTFPRGQMVPEFENAAFEQGAGKLSLVNTTFGYHILWTINKTSESLVLFKDVEKQIQQALGNQQQEMLYSNFIAQLRAKAKIVNYVEEEAKAAAQKAAEEQALKEKAAAEEQKENASASANTNASGAATTQVNIIEPAQTQENQTAGEGAAGANVPSVVQEEQIVNEQAALQNETVQAVEEVLENTSETAAKPALGFADCLNSQGAVLYGMYWDSMTKTQKNYFGADASKITYVECGVPGDYTAVAAMCTEAGIQAYPSWVINNKRHMGLLELKDLSALTGCKI